MSRVACVLLLATCATARELPERWFYLARSLSSDEHVADFDRLTELAAQHGYTGVCWAGPEGICRFDEARLARVERVKKICAARRIEIIPLIFSVGYGGAALAYDANLAVGHRVEGLRFKVAGGVARHLPDPDLKVTNAGFEEGRNHAPSGWGFVDKPGQIAFLDTAEKHSGEVSLRLENPGDKGLGQHARAMQAVTVKPHRHYRVTVWVKAEGLQPAGAFRLQIYAGGGEGPNLIAAPVDGETFAWRQVALTFDSQEYDRVRLYFGTWGGRTGRFWLDDVAIEELGLNNLIRRDGCPLRVTGADGATVYEEGRDFQPVADPRPLDFSVRPGPEVRLTDHSRIPDGAELLVSAYHAGKVAAGQVSVCMSAPGLYEHYEQVAKRLAEVLPCRQFLLSMDEIRQGGTDLADQSRNLSMAEILGDCITRQQAILRRHHPDATCFVWSDMLDPGHNAHGNYYQVAGDFTGSWNHVPKDLVMACWYGDKAKSSLAFFDGLGFRTLGAAYYDADDLAGSRRWLEALAQTPRAVGIMYTTWRNKYALLGPFGDLVSGFGR